ncbi:MAG: KH domain-containing protein [Candidatus Aenigmarchaeota archaeon]|nr:KH domain-containing protein [Candidatus Aenigmarchaeota archaeon]
MIDEVKIPDLRKGVLIGPEGSVKKGIEKRTRTIITVNDCVEINGEALDVMKAKEIVKAIGRGFAPDKALKLMSDDYRLVIISLGHETERLMKRTLSRVIGSDGKAKKTIELLTTTDICVYGKTISIIGKWDNVDRANEALELLIEGKPHAYVYKRLESQKEGEEKE